MKRRTTIHVVVLLTVWISTGLTDDAIDYEEARSRWAFTRPIDRADTIAAPDARQRLDGFIQAARDARHLKAVPPARSGDLLRRASFALRGFPPTPWELAGFLADTSPETYEKMLDRWLASPAYGERWGRRWLDVARYADTNGLDENMAYTSAYRYRDYVVSAFNEDLPYDRFVVEQLAGDLLGGSDPAKDAGAFRRHVAAGFLSVGPKMLACDDPEKMRMDIVDDQIDTTGRAFLGMTFGCARCHDHKFDPFSIEDYYSLAGVFRSTTTITNYKVVAKWHEYDFSPPEIKGLIDRISKAEARLKSEKDKERKNRIKREIEDLQAERNRKTKSIMAVREGTPEDIRVHLRGNYLMPGKMVKRSVPVVFSDENTEPMPAASSGRLQLARWIASRDNPLTARVMMNRLWRWHFGRGIVPTVDNFGALGERPTHPELLDHLAVRFMESGWSVKRMQRLVMTSSVYRRSTQYDPVAASMDPDNVFLWRFNRRRLEAEELRDTLLMTSGQLDTEMFGQLMTDAPGKYANSGKLPDYWNSHRRSVYLPVMRSGGYDAFVAFDFADASVLNGDRNSSTVTPQSLFMLNGPLVFASAKSMIEALTGTPEPDERLKKLYITLFSRVPEPDEIEEALRFMDRYESESERKPGHPELAWEALCRVLFASNEFLYIE